MKVIGLMSGTSVDGIDAALVEINGKDVDLQVELLAGETYPYPVALREQIIAVSAGEQLSVAELAALDDAIATQFAQAAQKIQWDAASAQLIGSHGQTVLHRPPIRHQGKLQLGYSLQLGRGELIVHLTGIPTVSNFRAADLAAGGQGAPLVPKVDAYLLSHPHRSRAVQNIGGIGNVTYLPPRQGLNWEEKVLGWDTGPGNALIDLAVAQLTDGQKTFDADGSWAAQGTPCESLVKHWLTQAFFQEPPPKSTGKEMFSEAYLQQCWQDAQNEQLTAADFLATLTEFTVESIVDSYRRFLPQMPAEVLLCGGGSHNQYLRKRLEMKLAPDSLVLTTAQVGLHGDFKEAVAFAVLAYWRYVCSIAGNLPQVTGANQSRLLGDIHNSVS